MLTPANCTLPEPAAAAEVAAAADEVLAVVATEVALVVVAAAVVLAEVAAAVVAGAFVLLDVDARCLVLLSDGLYVEDLCLEGLCFGDSRLEDVCLGCMCLEEGRVLSRSAVGEWMCAGADLCMLEWVVLVSCLPDPGVHWA